VVACSSSLLIRGYPRRCQAETPLIPPVQIPGATSVLAVTLFVGVVYAVVNLLVDLTQAALDPRVAEQL
jgi:hypothetical protein